MADGAQKLNGLMICNLFTLPYRVMRCAADSGVDVYVLGNEISKGLKNSRYCNKFLRSEHEFDGGFSCSMVAEINQLIQDLKIDVVFPGDAPSSRSLHGMKDLLDARTFPGPTLTQFDTLNNKWEFKNICDRLGIPTPETRRFETKADLEAAFKAGELKLPCIVKPFSLDASHGVLKVEASNAVEQIGKVDYEPILAQDFIEGLDIGASIYCSEGKVLAFIAHKFYGRTYTTFEAPDVLENLTKFAESMKLNGVYNFDMRLDDAGNVLYLECNPRFFYKMYLSLMAGINFAKPGFFPNGSTATKVVPDGTVVRMPLALPFVSYKPWVISKRDLKMAGFLLRDPVCYVRESLRIDWD